MTSSKRILAAYRPARDAFAALGVDTDAALRRLAGISRFPSIAGKAMTWRDLKTPAVNWAAAWR